jgi:hypothetical protein
MKWGEKRVMKDTEGINEERKSFGLPNAKEQEGQRCVAFGRQCNEPPVTGCHVTEVIGWEENN